MFKKGCETRVKRVGFQSTFSFFNVVFWRQPDSIILACVDIWLFVIFFEGTLHVGDEIKEINGISVARQSVENLQAILVCISMLLPL